MNCGKCAFNVSKKECAVLKKKPKGDCWAGCYSIDNLKNRYQSIMNYSSHVDVHTKANNELKRFKKRLEGDKKC